MNKIFNELVNAVKSAISSDMKDVYSVKGDATIKMVLAAYNDFQESERDGVDYIFNIENQRDLKDCVRGGLTAKEICGLYNHSQMDSTSYFYFGCNYQTPKQIDTWEELRTNLVKWLDDILEIIIKYPYSYDSYKDIYQLYVVDCLEK